VRSGDKQKTGGKLGEENNSLSAELSGEEDQNLTRCKGLALLRGLGYVALAQEVLLLVISGIPSVRLIGNFLASIASES